MLWTEMWEVEFFLTLLAEPSRRTPTDHDCVCELGLVGHLGRNDLIAEACRRFGGSWDTSNECEWFRRAGPGIQTGSGAANLTLETGRAFNVLWFSQEEHTLDAHRAENGSVQIHIPIQISQLPVPGLPKSPCLVSRAPGPFRQRSNQWGGREYPEADITAICEVGVLQHIPRSRFQADPPAILLSDATLPGFKRADGITPGLTRQIDRPSARSLFPFSHLGPLHFDERTTTRATIFSNSHRLSTLNHVFTTVLGRDLRLGHLASTLQKY